ncbi:hypothetical protein [uncultured Rhodoferax sp.]|uniref:hypothetical protein n=1 Tax=uncultured Rhodoferax sp. TaxID=223188 RepID=UPI0025CE41A5|nr:hypothetical protein [uncultured Rhodoferax sp.]
MADEVPTDQLVAALVMKAADDVASGMTRAQVVQALVDLAATREVAEAIALRGEDLYVSRGGVLKR